MNRNSWDGIMKEETYRYPYKDLICPMEEPEGNGGTRKMR